MTTDDPLQTLPQPLASIINDARRAKELKLYYPALLISLTLPEICAGMQLEKHEFVKSRHYIAFLRDFSEPKALGVDPTLCYQMRGGLVHKGNIGNHPHSNLTHVLFSVPETGMALHGMTLEVEDYRGLNLTLLRFCKAMEDAVFRWFDANRHNKRVIENMGSLLHYRSNGMPPFVTGFPVVGSGTQLSSKFSFFGPSPDCQ